MTGFFEVLALIAVGAGFPIVYMWFVGKFIDHKPAPKEAKAAVLGIATLAIGYSTLLAVGRTGFGDAWSLPLGALMAGSRIVGIVALQESFEGEQDGAK